MITATHRSWAMASALFLVGVPRLHGQAEDGEAAWSFLAAKYDADRDGRITAEEHARGEVSFHRLDRDGDGVITSLDFVDPKPAAGAEQIAAERRKRILNELACGLLVRVFAEDATDALPSAAQVSTRFAAMDRDDDERIDRAEFEADLQARRKTTTTVIQKDRFEVLCLAMPAPDQGLSVGGLLALFRTMDTDGDGILRGAELPDMGRIARRLRPHEDESNARAACGQPAPDFTLPAADGSGTITLSSYRGDRPVALIFGSFT